MAASAALGAVLKYYDASDANPATVAGLVEVTPPELLRETAEYTAHSDTVRKRLGTIRDSGPVSARIRFDSAETTHGDSTGVRSLYTSGARRKWAVVLSDTGADDISFYGYVTSFKVLPQTVDGVVEAEFEIQVDGECTFA